MERVASVGETEQLMLTRPSDGRVEQAGNADATGEPAVDGRLDEVRCEEGERDRHLDVSLAASLPSGDAVDRRDTGRDFGQPLASSRDCSDELDPNIGADREDCGW